MMSFFVFDVVCVLLVCYAISSLFFCNCHSTFRLYFLVLLLLWILLLIHSQAWWFSCSIYWSFWNIFAIIFSKKNRKKYQDTFRKILRKTIFSPTFFLGNITRFFPCSLFFFHMFQNILSNLSNHFFRLHGTDLEEAPSSISERIFCLGPLQGNFYIKY